MTTKEGEEMFPMGYAAFYAKWTENGSVVDLTNFAQACSSGPHREFRLRFQSIIEGVIEIGRKKTENENDNTVVVPDQRLRCLQHRLIDLIGILDPHNLRTEKSKHYMTRCGRAATCHCKNCLKEELCPCDDCVERKKTAQRQAV
jgi:hypothetical protein